MFPANASFANSPQLLCCFDIIESEVPRDVVRFIVSANVLSIGFIAQQLLGSHHHKIAKPDVIAIGLEQHISLVVVEIESHKLLILSAVKATCSVINDVAVPFVQLGGIVEIILEVDSNEAWSMKIFIKTWR